MAHASAPPSGSAFLRIMALALTPLALASSVEVSGTATLALNNSNFTVGSALSTHTSGAGTVTIAYQLNPGEQLRIGPIAVGAAVVTLTITLNEHEICEPQPEVIEFQFDSPSGTVARSQVQCHAIANHELALDCNAGVCAAIAYRPAGFALDQQLFGSAALSFKMRIDARNGPAFNDTLNVPYEVR